MPEYPANVTGKAKSTIGLQWIYSIIHIDLFLDLTLKVYFDSNKHSEAEFVIVNCGLEMLYREVSISSEVIGAQKEDSMKMRVLCRANLETALANLPLHLPTTMDMVVALLFGVWPDS